MSTNKHRVRIDVITTSKKTTVKFTKTALVKSFKMFSELNNIYSVLTTQEAWITLLSKDIKVDNEGVYFKSQEHGPRLAAQAEEATGEQVFDFIKQSAMYIDILRKCSVQDLLNNTEEPDEF